MERSPRSMGRQKIGRSEKLSKAHARKKTARAIDRKRRGGRTLKTESQEQYTSFSDELPTETVEEREERKQEERFYRELEEAMHAEVFPGQDYRDVLAEVGVPKELIERIEEREDGRYVVQPPDHPLSEALPAGYGFKGGVARELLQAAVGFRRVEDIQPRDWDLLSFHPEGTVDADKKDQAVIQQCVPKDMQDQDMIETYKPNYLEKRDLTVNEVYYDAGSRELICTRACLFDAARGILRRSAHDIESFDATSYSIPSKMLTKMLRMLREAKNQGYHLKMDIIDPYIFEKHQLNGFWCCVQLNKAYGIDPELAQQFVDLLIERRRLPEGTTVGQAMTILEKDTNQGTFDFRDIPADIRREVE